MVPVCFDAVVEDMPPSFITFFFSSLYKENTEKPSIFYPASFKLINLQVMGTLDLIA